MRTLKRGNFGLDVVRLQIRLDLFPFGYFNDRSTTRKQVARDLTVFASLHIVNRA